MTDTVSNTYCFNCQRFKRSFNKCLTNHHELYFFNSNYKLPSDFPLSNRKLFCKRFVSVPDEPIETYTLSESECTNLCPIHKNKALGYCFDCKRCICLTSKFHFSHDYILFFEFGISNDLEYNDNTIAKYKKLVEEKRMINDNLLNKDKLLKYNFDVKTCVLKLISSKIRFLNSTNCISNLIQLLVSFDSFSIDYDSGYFDFLKSRRTKLELKQRNFFYSRPLQTLISRLNAIQTSDPLPISNGKIKTDSIHGNYKCLFHFANSSDLTTNIIVRRNEDAHEKHKFTYFVRRDYSDETRLKFTNYQTSDFHIYYSDFEYARFNHITKSVSIVKIDKDTKKHQTAHILQNKYGNKRTNLNIKNNLYFLNENYDLIKYNLKTQEEMEISCPYQFTRLLTLFQTNIEVFGVTPDAEIYYLKESRWYEFPINRPFDNIQYFIGNVFNKNVEFGAIASNRYIFKTSGETTKILCNGIYCDESKEGLTLILNKSLKPLNVPI